MIPGDSAAHQITVPISFKIVKKGISRKMSWSSTRCLSPRRRIVRHSLGSCRQLLFRLPMRHVDPQIQSFIKPLPSFYRHSLPSASGSFVPCQPTYGMSLRLICVVVFTTMAFFGSAVHRRGVALDMLYRSAVRKEVFVQAALQSGLRQSRKI
jgi:hypothetical protein